LYYIASGIITPVGGSPAHRYYTASGIITPTECADTRCCIIQF